MEGFDWIVGKPVIELGAQPADMAIDNIGRRIEGYTPHRFKEHLAGDFLSWVAHHERQEVELSRLQVNLTTGPTHAARQKVDLEVAGFKLGRQVTEHRPALKSCEASMQFRQREGLDEIIVGTALKPADTIRHRTQRGQHQRRQMHSVGAPMPEHCDAIDIGQETVDDRHVIPVAIVHCADRLATCRHMDDVVSETAQSMDDQLSGYLIVFH